MRQRCNAWITAILSLLLLSTGAMGNLRQDISDYEDYYIGLPPPPPISANYESMPSVVICYDGKNAFIVEPYQGELPYHIRPEEICYTGIKNGVLLAYAHLAGANEDYVLSYNIKTAVFYIGEYTLWGGDRWPGSKIFSNGVFGTTDIYGIIYDERTFDTIPYNALLLNERLERLETQLQFDYGKDGEWVSKGLEYNAATEQYILVVTNKETAALKIAQFDINGKQLNEFYLNGITYKDYLGKHSFSPPLYVYALPNNKLLIGTQPTVNERWMALVDLDRETTRLLDGRQLIRLLFKEKLKAVKNKRLGWFLLPDIEDPPFSIKRTAEEVSIYLDDSQTPLISINPHYNILVDWEEYGNGGFYAVFNCDADFGYLVN